MHVGNVLAKLDLTRAPNSLHGQCSTDRAGAQRDGLARPGPRCPVACDATIDCLLECPHDHLFSASGRSGLRILALYRQEC